jgi:hypothetical protein
MRCPASGRQTSARWRSARPHRLDRGGRWPPGTAVVGGSHPCCTRTKRAAVSQLRPTRLYVPAKRLATSHRVRLTISSGGSAGGTSHSPSHFCCFGTTSTRCSGGTSSTPPPRRPNAACRRGRHRTAPRGRRRRKSRGASSTDGARGGDGPSCRRTARLTGVRRSSRLAGPSRSVHRLGASVTPSLSRCRACQGERLLRRHRWVSMRCFETAGLHHCDVVSARSMASARAIASPWPNLLDP